MKANMQLKKKPNQSKLFALSWRNNNWIHALHKSIDSIWNADSFN